MTSKLYVQAVTLRAFLMLFDRTTIQNQGNAHEIAHEILRYCCLNEVISSKYKQARQTE